jgi:two-component system NarL family sensor kinase
VSSPSVRLPLRPRTPAPAAAHRDQVRGGALAGAVPVAAASLLATALSVLAVLDVEGWTSAGGGSLPVDVVVGTTYPLVGALVLAGRRPSRRLGWLLLGVGAAAALTVVATTVALLADAPTRMALMAVHLQSWLWVPGFLPLVTLLPLLYPDGRPLGPRWRWAVATSTAGMALMAAGAAAFPQVFEGTVPLEHPWTSSAVAQALFPLGGALCGVSVLAGIASLVVRLRRATGLERRQVVVFLVAAGAVVLSLGSWRLLPAPLGTVVQAVAVGLLPVAVGIAVTRHRLYDLDLAVCRALVVVSLGGCLAGAYLTLFALLDAAAPGGTGVPSAVAAAGTGLLVHPLAVRLSHGVDRLFYGERADPYAFLSTFSASLRSRLDVPQVPAAVCDAALSSLRLSSASLRLPGAARALASAGLASAGLASAGQPAGQPYDVELHHGSELVGVLTVTPRVGEQVLDARDADLLAALADAAAPALAALRLTEDLRRSREALVTAREEERRRLRRELHDGVGAALAGLRLQLDAAHELVNDPRPRRILDAARAGDSEAVGDVRRITEDLRPPALDELGLAGSLRALGDRSRTPALEVGVEVPADLPTLPAATEVACYRIAAEALANVARHSGARTVRVRLEVGPDAVRLEVADDGHGVRPGAASSGSGLGLSSMRLRAEELGGRWALDSSADGTRVQVELPR